MSTLARDLLFMFILLVLLSKLTELLVGGLLIVPKRGDKILAKVVKKNRSNSHPKRIDRKGIPRFFVLERP